jgi:antitoxin component YwqK of YwqJK toxin-antitoxin module
MEWIAAALQFNTSYRDSTPFLEEIKTKMSERETRRILGEQSQVLATAEYLDGQLDGVSRVYTPSGALIQEMRYQGGQLHGQYRAWWDNGVLKECGQYADGQRIGEYRWYEEKGKLLQSHTYVASQG